MKLTLKLKNFAIEELGVKSDASDEEFKTAVAGALLSGKLTAEKHAELSADEDDEEAEGVLDRLDKLATSFEKGIKLIEESEKNKKKDDDSNKAAGASGGTETPPNDGGGEQKPQPSRMAKMVSSLGGMTEDGDQTIDIRVKSAVESYDSTKSALMYPELTKANKPHSKAGQRVVDLSSGRGLDNPSDRDKALAGVWAKYQLAAVTPRIAGNPQRAWELLTEHEKGLLAHLAEYEQWDASEDEKPRIEKGYRGGIKALIDDSTSGGLEAAPIVFDDQVIQTPLLHGELYPLVNEVPLSRGRRVEGVATLTVTGTWGGVDDSAISLFNTASYVSAFDTTIHRWEGAVRIGLDFMSDTPIDFGSHITAQYGERLLEDLDDAIATGNGTTAPEGVMNKSGTTSVAFAAATTLSNYESLRFGVAKAEHRATVKASAVFCGTETSYSRARGIPVGAADARRLGGMDYDSYSWMQRPYKINESLTNSQIFYVILARYRMYRRKGFTVRTSTEGDTLIRANEMLIVVMARYGGQLERGAVAAVTTTAPA